MFGIVAPRILRKKLGLAELDFDGYYLLAPVCAVGGIYPVRHKECAVRVFNEFRKLELICAAALARTLLGLFAFWLSHSFFAFLNYFYKLKRRLIYGFAVSCQHYF